MNADVICTCESPEPALVEHGLYSLCEKCGQYIGEAPPTPDEGEAAYREHEWSFNW